MLLSRQVRLCPFTCRASTMLWPVSLRGAPLGSMQKQDKYFAAGGLHLEVQIPPNL